MNKGDKQIMMEMKITDPRLLKCLKKGWATGFSIGSGGSGSFVPTYPWWYRWWIGIKGFFSRSSRYEKCENPSFDPNTGVIDMGGIVPKEGAAIVIDYKYTEKVKK